MSAKCQKQTCRNQPSRPPSLNFLRNQYIQLADAELVQDLRHIVPVLDCGTDRGTGEAMAEKYRALQIVVADDQLHISPDCLVLADDQFILIVPYFDPPAGHYVDAENLEHCHRHGAAVAAASANRVLCRDLTLLNSRRP